MPLHPQAKQFLEDLAAEGVPEWSEMPPEQSRQLFADLTDLFGQQEAVQDVADHQVADGVGCRAFTPNGEGPFPAVMYFHGGGWVLGDLNTHDALCRRLANRSGCVVVAVDYRRAPEHKFPAALDDCWAATQHVAQHGAHYRVDPSRLVVAGDSAGGNLAAAVAMRARDGGGPELKLQLLIYPVLQASCDTPSYGDFATDFGLTRGSMIWFWQQYLAQKADAENPYAAPASAQELSGLPPAHVITAEYDVLRDEGESFARRLADASVPTTTQRYDGMLHGFVHFAGVFDGGIQAADDLGHVLRRAVQLDS